LTSVERENKRNEQRLEIDSIIGLRVAAAIHDEEVEETLLRVLQGDVFMPMRNRHGAIVFVNPWSARRRIDDKGYD